MKIEWHPLARTDFAEIISYIAPQNATAAYRLQEEIDRRITILAIFPNAGRAGRVSGSRELVITDTPYVVAYRVSEETIVILRVLHGARRWPAKI